MEDQEERISLNRHVWGIGPSFRSRDMTSSLPLHEREVPPQRRVWLFPFVSVSKSRTQGDDNDCDMLFVARDFKKNLEAQGLWTKLV